MGENYLITYRFNRVSIQTFKATRWVAHSDDPIGNDVSQIKAVTIIFESTSFATD